MTNSVDDIGDMWMIITQGHKKMVLDGVITYFVQQDEKHAPSSTLEHRFVCWWSTDCFKSLEHVVVSVFISSICGNWYEPLQTRSGLPILCCPWFVILQYQIVLWAVVSQKSVQYAIVWYSALGTGCTVHSLTAVHRWSHLCVSAFMF